MVLSVLVSNRSFYGVEDVPAKLSFAVRGWFRPFRRRFVVRGGRKIILPVCERFKEVMIALPTRVSGNIFQNEVFVLHRFEEVYQRLASILQVKINL